ncbi:MAG TPA: hypothetical protein VMW19_20505 [Myxococcota bacterium]|nr:hypothetical protein [Myxococcota bacterium]
MNRWNVATASVITLVFAVAANLKQTSGERGQFEALIPIPPDFASTGLACEGGALVLFGHHSPLPSTRTDAKILRWTPGESAWESSYSKGGSRVSSWAVALDGEMTALISSGDEGGDLLRSSDHGRTWNKIGEAPKDAFGVEFFDAVDGFAWGDDSGYATREGGITWTARKIVGLFQRGSPWPVVDGADLLWVATRKIEGEHARFSLTLLDPTLSERGEISTSDRVVRMISSDSGLWLLVQKGGYGTAMVSRLETSEGRRIVPVFELNNDLPLDLAVRDSQIAVVLSDTDQFTSSRYVLLGEGEQTVSEWKKLALGSDDSLQFVCLDPDGRLWAVGRKWLWRSVLKN